MPKSRIPAEQAERIREAAGGICQRCNLPSQRLEVHHINEKGMGGTTHVYTDDELAAECPYCHGTGRVGGRPTKAQLIARGLWPNY